MDGGEGVKNFFTMLKNMDDEDKRDAMLYASGWLEKMSVGCLIVGMFQPTHVVGGVFCGLVFFFTGYYFKLRGRKWNSQGQ